MMSVRCYKSCRTGVLKVMKLKADSLDLRRSDMNTKSRDSGYIRKQKNIHRR